MERKSRLVELSLVIVTSICVSPEVNRTMVPSMPSTASMSGSAPAGVVGGLVDGAVVDGVVLALADGRGVVDVAVVGEDPGGLVSLSPDVVQAATRSITASGAA